MPSQMSEYSLFILSDQMTVTTVWFTVEILLCRKRIQQRLALYQGVCPIYMEFTDDAEDTFANALATLLVNTLPTNQMIS